MFVINKVKKLGQLDVRDSVTTLNNSIKGKFKLMASSEGKDAYTYKLLYNDKPYFSVSSKGILLDRSVPFVTDIGTYASLNLVATSALLELFKLYILKFIEQQKQSNKRNSSSQQIGQSIEILKTIEGQIESIETLTLAEVTSPGVVYTIDDDQNVNGFSSELFDALWIDSKGIGFKFVSSEQPLVIERTKVNITNECMILFHTNENKVDVSNIPYFIYKMKLKDDVINAKKLAGQKFEYTTTSQLINVFSENRHRLMYKIADLLSYTNLPSDISMEGLFGMQKVIRTNLYNFNLEVKRNIDDKYKINVISQYKSIEDALGSFPCVQAYISDGVKSNADKLSVNDKSRLYKVINADGESVYNELMDKRYLPFSTFTSDKERYIGQLKTFVSILCVLTSDAKLKMSDNGVDHSFTITGTVDALFEGIIGGFFYDRSAQ